MDRASLEADARDHWRRIVRKVVHARAIITADCDCRVRLADERSLYHAHAAHRVLVDPQRVPRAEDDAPGSSRRHLLPPRNVQVGHVRESVVPYAESLVRDGQVDRCERRPPKEVFVVDLVVGVIAQLLPGHPLAAGVHACQIVFAVGAVIDVARGRVLAVHAPVGERFAAPDHAHTLDAGVERDDQALGSAHLVCLQQSFVVDEADAEAFAAGATAYEKIER